MTAPSNGDGMSALEKRTVMNTAAMDAECTATITTTPFAVSLSVWTEAIPGTAAVDNAAFVV